MAVSWPGARSCCSAWAEVQPQETRTEAMCTRWLVLLTRRNGCVSVGPRGTDPKSRESSSKSASAHEAEAEPAVHRPSKTTRLKRENMLPFPCCQNDPRPPGAAPLWDDPRSGARKRNRAIKGHYLYSPRRPLCQHTARDEIAARSRRPHLGSATITRPLFRLSSSSPPAVWTRIVSW